MRSLALLALASALAACSSAETARRSGAPTSDTAAVATATTGAEPARDGSSGSSGRADAPAGTTREASEASAPPPAGPRDVHADRERVIEQAADEDRPSGTSTLRVETQGTVSGRCGAALPRYAVGSSAEPRDSSPVPDSSVMKFVPGPAIDLPPPPAKPPEVEGTNEPGQSLLVPREAR
jgi:hypothetical protein